MCVSGVYALTTDTEVKNTVSTGAVEIDLKTYTIGESGTEELYTEEKKSVMPGNEISLIPKVSNKAEDCYIRAKITINRADLCSVKEICAGWTKYGDYYYLDEIFNSGQSVNLFEAIKIADVVSGEDSEATIIVTVRVEAIQAKNFEPDYSLGDPWKGEEIEKCIEKSYSVDGDETPATTIMYSPESVEITSNFFDEFNKLMPGDEISDTVKIKNKHSKDTKIIMDVIPENLDDEADEFLKKLTFKIKDENGNTIYEGNLYDAKSILLGRYSSGEEKTLTYSVFVPPELKNRFSKLKSGLNWIFYTEDFEEENEEPDKSNEQSYNRPKTGDYKFDVSIGVFFTSTLGLIIVMLIGFIEKRKNKKNI